MSDVRVELLVNSPDGICNSAGTVLFKRLHVDGDHYTFISINPVYPPITVEKAKIERVLPIGGTYQETL